MKILICTQSVNLDDPLLGFFHRWIEKIAAAGHMTTVICLFKGRNTLPPSVPVLSLGKELCATTFRKIILFFMYILKARGRYDAVFVHMNKEYVIMGWFLWLLMGKKVIFWYNHPTGDFQARLAGLLAGEIMYTSPQSFFGRQGKGTRMPVGIDTDLFTPTESAVKDHIAYVGRISPVKNIDVILDAFASAKSSQPGATLDIYGNVPALHKTYAETEKRRADSIGSVSWRGDVNNADLPGIYSRHAAIVNATDNGSFDKVICEAMACERVVIASNKAYKDMVPETYQNMLCPQEKDSKSFAESLKKVLSQTEADRARIGGELRAIIVRDHSLDKLISMLDRAAS